MANNANDVVLTADGKAKLEEELHYLENDKRDEVGERIRIAREFGDISENSEYDDAKNEQAILEQRIAEINDVLANAQIVDTPKKGNRVVIGSTVTLTDMMAASASSPSSVVPKPIARRARSPTSPLWAPRCSVTRRAMSSSTRARPVAR